MNDIIKNHRAFVANQIEKSFDSGISVPQQLDIEKAKWKVGDEKQYQGATWVVGGFNAKGVPLWRKKKDSGAAAGGSGGATPKAAPAASNKTSDTPKSTGNAFDFNSGSSDWEVTKKDWQTQYRNEKLGVGVHVDKFGWYVVQNNRGYMKRWKTKDEAVKSVQEAVADQASVKSVPAAQSATEEPDDNPAAKEPYHAWIQKLSPKKRLEYILDWWDDETVNEDEFTEALGDFIGSQKTAKKITDDIYTNPKYGDDLDKKREVLIAAVSEYLGIKSNKTTSKSTQTPAPASQNAAPQTKSPADMTFDEAVAIGVPNLTQKKKDEISKYKLQTLREDLSDNGYLNEDERYYRSQLKEAIAMKIGYKKWDAPNGIVDKEFKEKHIRNLANRLATVDEERKFYKAVLKKKNAEKKQFLDSTGRDFTEEQVETYLKEYAPYEPSAVVNNTWHTYMGRIGNTSATIKIGNGKEKSLNDGIPNWRPIGNYSYHVRGWDGKLIQVKGVIQSWNDVRNALSDTESLSISIWKHPKQ